MRLYGEKVPGAGPGSPNPTSSFKKQVTKPGGRATGRTLFGARSTGDCVKLHGLLCSNTRLGRVGGHLCLKGGKGREREKDPRKEPAKHSTVSTSFNLTAGQWLDDGMDRGTAVPRNTCWCSGVSWTSA